MTQSSLSAVEQLKASIIQSKDHFFNGQEAITETCQELCSTKLSSQRAGVSKHELIFGLINRLELETDEERCECYRDALKIVVQSGLEKWVRP